MLQSCHLLYYVVCELVLEAYPLPFCAALFEPMTCTLPAQPCSAAAFDLSSIECCAGWVLRSFMWWHQSWEAWLLRKPSSCSLSSLCHSAAASSTTPWPAPPAFLRCSKLLPQRLHSMHVALRQQFYFVTLGSCSCQLLRNFCAFDSLIFSAMASTRI